MNDDRRSVEIRILTLMNRSYLPNRVEECLRIRILTPFLIRGLLLEGAQKAHRENSSQ
jgi:hypothetical protein